MPIINYPGYISKEEAAARYNVQVRTINDRIRRKELRAIKIEGFYFVKDSNNQTPPPAGVSLADLQSVTKFARKHKVIPERIYTPIVMGKISAVILADRIFVMKSDPQLIAFTQNLRK